MDVQIEPLPGVGGRPPRKFGFELRFRSLWHFVIMGKQSADGTGY